MRLFGLSLALGGCFKLKSVLKVFFNGLHGEAHNEALPNPSHVGEWEERFPTTTQPPPNPFLKGTICLRGYGDRKRRRFLTAHFDIYSRSLLKYIIVIYNVHINGRILTEYSGLLSLAFIIANWLHNILNLVLARISLPKRDW